MSAWDWPLLNMVARPNHTWDDFEECKPYRKEIKGKLRGRQEQSHHQLRIPAPDCHWKDIRRRMRHAWGTWNIYIYHFSLKNWREKAPLHVTSEDMKPKWAQWLRLDLSKEHKRVGVSLPSPEETNRSSFRNDVFSSNFEIQMADKLHKPSDSEWYIPWQNALDSAKLYGSTLQWRVLCTNALVKCECSSEVLCASVLVKYFVRVY
jgi:hypothetical protein